MTTTPSFLITDVPTLYPQLVAAMETALGKTLYPAQVERILVDVIAYREALVRQAIQSTAEQNLVDFATGSRLERLGRLLGVSNRMTAAAATTTWHLVLPEVSAESTTFPAGWEAVDPSGLTWATTEEAVIPAGSLAADAIARCRTAGTAGNGLIAGTTFSPLTGAATVTSLTTSSGGTATETDAALRARILAAPFGFSVAGPAKAYYFHALNVHASIVDVAVKTGAPGTVLVYPLVSTGLPSSEILAAVLEALSQETVRPLCDAVSVLAPTRLAYTLEANLWVETTADSTAVMLAAEASGTAYLNDRRAALGKDLVASQAVKALMVPGVYKVELVGWTDHVLEAEQWADGTLALHFAGTAHG